MTSALLTTGDLTVMHVAQHFKKKLEKHVFQQSNLRVYKDAEN